MDFHNFGYEVEVYGYSRGVYTENSLPCNIKLHSLGYAKNGEGYIKKAVDKIKVVRKILKKNADQNVLYYSFSFDFTLALFFLSKSSLYIYEISDLVYGYFKYTVLRLPFKMIDAFLCKRAFLTIFTSRGFYTYLFGDKNIENCIIQPNRVNKIMRKINRLDYVFSQQSDRIRFSFIGAFRYPNTVFRFAKVIGEFYPQHEFLFWGDSELTEEVKKISSEYKNVHYLGSYKNPEDLPMIYKTVDVLVCCYDTKTLNERVAEPNKLYESICFCKPIICSPNTFLESRVEKLEIGYSLDSSEDSNIKSFVNSLTKNDLFKKSKKCLCYNEELFLDSAECIFNYINKYYNIK